MKIGSSPETKIAANASALPQAAKAQQSAVGTAQATAKSAGVAVTVSTQTQALEKVRGEASSPEVDLAKVQAVRAAIDDGSFVVNPEAIADKLLGNAQELLNRTKN